MFGLGATVITINGGRSGGERSHGSCVAKVESNSMKGMEVGKLLVAVLEQVLLVVY